MRATALTSPEGRRAWTWKLTVWTSVMTMGFIAAFGPLLLPIPHKWAYAIMLPANAVCFALGWARYRTPRPATGLAAPKSVSRGTKRAMAIIPAAVIIVMSALHPTGPVFNWAINVACLPLMYGVGRAYAFRSRVPDNFAP